MPTPHHPHKRTARRAGHAAKRYQPGPVHLNNIERAITGARRLPDENVAEVCAAMDVALVQFGRGQDCPLHWRSMADAMNVAEQLAAVRICSDDTSAGMIQAAQAVLAAVQGRQATTGSWTLRSEERKALDDGLWLHGVQLRNCSFREYETAVARCQAVVRGALAGNVGAGTVVVGAPAC